MSYKCRFVQTRQKSKNFLSYQKVLQITQISTLGQPSSVHDVYDPSFSFTFFWVFCLKFFFFFV